MKIGITLTLGFVLGAGALALAQHAQKGQEGIAIEVLAEREIQEVLDGKPAQATVVQLTLEPGASGAPHRHAGPVFGYVAEGEFELGLADQAAQTLKAGTTFYEPTGILHRVSRNPSTKHRSRVIALLLHARDAKRITIPESETK